jgi:hypothetical protein
LRSGRPFARFASLRPARRLGAGIARTLRVPITRVIRSAADRTDPEEPWAAPGGTGDGARDGREARVGEVAPHVAVAYDRYRVSFALVFPDQDCADLEASQAIRSWLVASRKTIKELGGFVIETAQALFLDMPADEPGNEVFGEGRRRRCSECRVPQGAQLIEAERPYAGNLGLQRLFAIGSHRRLISR